MVVGMNLLTRNTNTRRVFELRKAVSTLPPELQRHSAVG